MRTLGILAGATTPANVIAARRGATVACPAGGSVLAFLPRSGRRVLRVTWSACTYLNGSQRVQLDGAGEVELPANTFAPEYVTSLHLGTLGDSLISLTTVEYSPLQRTEAAYDLHVVGRVPLTRFRNVGIFTGIYDMTIDGSVDYTYTSLTLDPDFPVIVSHYFRHADDFRVVGSTIHSEQDTVLTEDLTVRHGTAREIGTGAYSPPEADWPTISGQDFHVRRVLSVRDATSIVQQDGLFYQHVSPFGTCGDGWYSFRTLAPIRQYNVFRYDGRDAGQVVLNGAKITFSTTNLPVEPPYDGYVVGADERAVQVTVDMGAAGTLEHASYLFGVTLGPLTPCPAP